MKATMIAQQGANQVAVDFDELHQCESHRFFKMSQCFSIEALSVLRSAPLAAFLAITTMSRLSILHRFKRKLSRICLFIRLRAAARLTFFLEIAKPSRVSPSFFLWAKTVR